jgi:hypothetical protein
MKDFEYEVGHRIELSPHTDQWMMGAQFGNVIKKEADGFYLLKMDKLRKNLRAKPEDFMSAAKGHPTREV